MAKINEDMNVNEIRDVLKEFNKQMGVNEIKGEQIQDGFEMFEDPGTQGEADDIYNGILGEIGLEYTEGTAAVPTGKIKVKQEQEEEKVEAGQEDELEARLNALRMA